MTEPQPSDAELDAIDRELRGYGDDATASTRSRMPPELRRQLEDAIEAQREIVAETRTQLPTPCFVGRRIGRFDLEERIGRGAQGEVWRAFDRREERIVALKLVPRSGDADDLPTRRFRREADLASRLSHPSLCPVYDAGEVDEYLYLAMRFIDGPSLADRESNHARPPGHEGIRNAVALASQLAEGLAAAHEAGILHRDVKPSNVRIDRDGTPVLVDFGLARDEQAGASLTGDATIGTPAYMPPEALSTRFDRSSHHDPRSDIWSLGVMLFELVAGERPFDAPTREGLYRAIMCAPPRVARRCNPAISRELAAVLELCLAKDPEQRFRDAALLASDLGRIARGERPHARPVGALRRTTRWVRGNPVPTAIGILLIALLGTSLALLQRAQDARRESDGMRLIANARTLAARSPGLSLSLALLGSELCPEASANDALLHALQHPWDERVWDLGAGTVHKLAFSADGEWIACACEDGSAQLLSIAGNRRIHLNPSGSPLRCVTFVDANRVAVAGDTGRITIWEPGTGATSAFAASDAAITAIAIGSARLAVGSESGTILIYREVDAEWQLEREFAAHEAQVTSLSWHGGQLVSSGNDGRAVRWNPSTRDAQQTFTHPMPRLGGATLTPDGLTMLCASTDNRLWAWDTASDARRFTASGHRSGLYSVAAHPTGPFALTTSFDRSAILWHTAHGRVLRRFVGHRRSVLDARFSPDGAYIATASVDGSVRLWSTHAPPQAQFVRPFGRITSAEFTADGESLVVSGEFGAAGVWSLADGERVFKFSEDRSSRMTRARASRDGSVICTIDNRGRLAAFDVESGAVRRRWRINSKMTDTRYSLQISPEGDQILVTDVTGSAYLFEMAATDSPLSLRGLANFYNVGRTSRATFLADGTSLATVIESDNHSFVVLWDRRSGARVREYDVGEGAVFSVTQHPKIPRLLLGCGRGVVVELDLETGEVASRTTGVGSITSARYDSTGDQIVASDQHGSIWLWTRPESLEGQRIQAHESVVYDVRFDAAGQRVLSTSWDGVASLWNVATLRCLLRIEGHDGPLFDASFAPMDDSIVTVGEDGAARTWPCDPLQFVSNRHHRGVTAAESELLSIEPASMPMQFR